MRISILVLLLLGVICSAKSHSKAQSKSIDLDEDDIFNQNVGFLQEPSQVKQHQYPENKPKQNSKSQHLEANDVVQAQMHQLEEQGISLQQADDLEFVQLGSSVSSQVRIPMIYMLQDDQIAQALSQIQMLQNQLEQIKSQQSQVLQDSTLQSTIQQPQLQQQTQPAVQVQNIQNNDEKRNGIVKPHNPALSEEVEQKISCEEAVTESQLNVCSGCQTDWFYELTEDNWYVIGLEHGYKKEFNLLVDQLREKLGPSSIYFSFNENEDICFASNEFKERLNVDQILQVYHGDSLSKYQMKNPLFVIPTLVQATYFQIRAVYDARSKRFNFEDFNLVINADSQKSIKQGGNIRSLYLSFKDNEATIIYDGSVNVLQKQLPFQFENYIGEESAERVRFNLSLKEHAPLLLNFAQQYLSKSYQDELSDFVKGMAGPYSVSHEAKLLLSTEENDDELNITFKVDRS